LRRGRRAPIGSTSEIVVAHHKDAIKRQRQNEERRLRNRGYRTRMRNQIKKVRDAVVAGDHAVATTELASAVKIIDRVAGKGIIHKKNAARRVSRLTKAVNGLRA